MRYLTELRTETRKINAEKDHLVDKKKALVESTTASHADVNRLHVYSKTLNKQRSLVDGRVSYLNDSIAYLRNKEDVLTADLEELKKRIEMLEEKKNNADLCVADAEKRATAAIERMETMTRHATDAEQCAADAEERVTVAEQKVLDAEHRVTIAEQRATDAEQCVADAEQKVLDAEQKVLDAEQKVLDAEQRVVAAEQKVLDAEQRAADAEQRVVAAEQKVSDAEQCVTVADEDAIAMLKRAQVTSGMVLNLVSKETLISRLEEEIDVQNERIVVRQERLKLNMGNIMQLDKDIVRSQHVITRLQQELLDIETDIVSTKEYVHKKRMLIMKQMFKEIL
jgi:chromosome segregation ATPase